MPPADYEKLVNDILAEHLFRPDRGIDAASLVADVDSAGHRISITTGTLWTTYEYIFGGGVEYGFGPRVETPQRRPDVYRLRESCCDHP